MVGKAQKLHGVRSELNSVFGLEECIGGTPLEHPPYSPDKNVTINKQFDHFSTVYFKRNMGKEWVLSLVAVIIFIYIYMYIYKPYMY
jgi:hypothetical protein